MGGSADNQQLLVNQVPAGGKCARDLDSEPLFCQDMPTLIEWAQHQHVVIAACERQDDSVVSRDGRPGGLDVPTR